MGQIQGNGADVRTVGRTDGQAGESVCGPSCEPVGVSCADPTGGPHGERADGPGDFFGVSVPFLALLGVCGEQAGGGHSRLSLDVRPALTNHFEGVHGGVLATLLDVAMASAARTMQPDAAPVVTVDMSLQFLRTPAPGRIVAEGRVRQGGRSMVFCDAEVRDAQGTLVATGIGTFKRRRDPRPDPPKP
jgi:uncharacterized protein (TIGR00369 family)